MRVKNGVEPINHTADTARGGSRPKPPKAVAQRASLEAPGAVSEHQTAKRRLTAKTVALETTSSVTPTWHCVQTMATHPSAMRLRTRRLPCPKPFCTTAEAAVNHRSA